MLRKEIKIFFTALMFYSRLPVPKSTGYSEENLNAATRYFPMVGAIIGALAAGVFYAASLVMPAYLAVLLSMVASIYCTGAFHEDGFADFCDGLGGGLTKEKALEIMKDSRLGTYGAIGLGLMLSAKFLCLHGLMVPQLPIFIFVAHVYSRIYPVLLIYTANYSRADASSKTKPIGKKGPMVSLVFALATGIAALAILPWQPLIIILPANIILFLVFRRYVIRKIDGYTGDVLGALQQLSEITFLLALVIYQTTLFWN